MLEKCKKCGEYTFNGKKCNCKPFKVYYPEYYGEDPETVYGFSHVGVAEKLAEKINCDDPVFNEDIFDYPVEITDGKGERKSFQCTAEVDINYDATEVES